VTPELLTEIQEEASLGGLAHIFPPESYPFPREAVLERWRTATDTIFADPDGHGFVAVAPPWLDALYVRPAAWGSGLADRLHEQAIEALRAAGVETARLWVLEENRRARRFYERHGWYADGSTREVPFPPHPIDVGYSLVL
jgi:GNAT superfamily N-acetyltransferase